MIPKVDVRCTYPVSSTFIQILGKPQLPSFVPNASPGFMAWKCWKPQSQAHSLPPCHPAPGRAAGKRPSPPGIQKQVATSGVAGADRFAETNKMAACLRVVRTLALTIASKTAKGLSPAPSFCFQNGTGLSASSHHISASMQMMNSGVSQGVNPMLSNSRVGK